MDLKAENIDESQQYLGQIESTRQVVCYMVSVAHNLNNLKEEIIIVMKENNEPAKIMASKYQNIQPCLYS